ncbi:MAG: CDP-alcohol phosphatidyltransferase family protein [Micromonosporaceae bacterium]
MPSPDTPGYHDFYRTNRGGGLFSEAVSQRLGAVVALVAARTGVRPTTLTLLNLVLGLAISAAVVWWAPRAAAGELPMWALGLGALVGWQLAYAIDCADGQLARVTGQTSSAGARVDILVDVAAQIALVAAIAAVAVAYEPETPVWLVAVFTGTWMVNLVASVLQSGANASSMITSASLPVRLGKLIRDYGAVVFACGLVLMLVPQLTHWLVVAVSLVNGGFLLASIAHSARTAYRETAQRATAQRETSA